MQQPKVRSWVSEDKTVLRGSLLDELAFLGAIRQISSLEPIRAGSGWKVLTLDGVGLSAPFRWRSEDHGAGECIAAGAMVLEARALLKAAIVVNSCDWGVIGTILTNRSFFSILFLRRHLDHQKRLSRAASPSRKACGAMSDRVRSND